MKKLFKHYAICWVIAIVVFNTIAFVIAGNTFGLSKLTFSFWIAYAFITLIFIGNLGCSFSFFKEENKSKVFLNIPVIYYAYCALIVSLIVGAVAMSVTTIPYWVGIIVDVLVLVFYAIAIIKAVAAAEMITAVEDKVKQQTSFVKMLTVDAESLVSEALSEEAKTLAKKVYEVIRYSDPMSVPELYDIEIEIKNKFSAFSDAIMNNNSENATFLADELIILISDRNYKCKVMK